VDDLAVGHLLVGLETHRLSALFAGLPASSPSPQVALVRAALAMARFDAAECTEALGRADAGARDVTGPPLAALRLGICAVRVIVSRLTGDLAAAETAGAEALTLMSHAPPDRLAQHPELPALVLSSLGTLQLWSGSLDAAESSLRAGLAAATGPFTEHARSNCLGQLALVHYLRGHLRAAGDCAVEALQIVDRSGLSSVTRVPVGHLAAAAVAWEWNDLPAVRTHVEHAGASVASRHDASIAVMVALLRARIRRSQGDSAQALRVLEAAAPERARVSPDSFVLPLLVVEEAMARLSCGQAELAASTLLRLPDGPVRRVALAQAHLAGGQPRAALTTLADTADDPTLDPALGVRAHLVMAQALHATRERAGTRRHLEQALREGRPEGFRRPFVEVGPWVRQMLAVDPVLAARHGWLGERLTGPGRRPAEVDDVPSLVVEPLTDRELQVLRMVAQPMASREVAENLHVSVSTVKTHLRSIYRKLAAPSRYQAVRRARTLGLL
jgi:LuxR family maltose regulon positive regulatory protein